MESELLEWERAAILVGYLARGGRLTSFGAGRLVGLSESGAAQLLNGLCRVTAIYCDRGKWKWLEDCANNRII